MVRANSLDEVKRLQGGIAVLSLLIEDTFEGAIMSELDKPESAPDYMSFDSDGVNGA